MPKNTSKNLKINAIKCEKNPKSLPILQEFLEFLLYWLSQWEESKYSVCCLRAKA
ncbi:hypothetical protein MFUM_220018 [Methylacidiphilum fumariolicum SolV]|uniref:Uncharacterized protein n=2 Tax=Candidatus Methylacidiphilum fumarolicum TaxID=591154 RepID=I0JX48_METFB|nr:conserved protein of unknown function [Candidatus Methylacidiphilum fumarolicum]CCG91817.1 hypothetical protein MFUM_220018 [Methylacidiphilum fumariolicum SolV]